VKYRENAHKYQNLDVCRDVMLGEGRPLSVREIVLIAGDSLPTRSKNPENVLSRDLSMSVKWDPMSPFVRVSPGLYYLRDAPSVREGAL
jgi:hypothetical protein